MMFIIFQQLKLRYQFEPSNKAGTCLRDLYNCSNALSLYARNSASMERIDQSHAQKSSGATTSILVVILPPSTGPWPGGWRPLL